MTMNDQTPREHDDFAHGAPDGRRQSASRLSQFGPLIDVVQQDLSLSATVAGCSSPARCFAFAVVLATGRFRDRIGVERAPDQFAMLALIAAFLIRRSFSRHAGPVRRHDAAGLPASRSATVLCRARSARLSRPRHGITTPAYPIMLGLTAAIGSGVSGPTRAHPCGGSERDLAVSARCRRRSLLLPAGVVPSRCAQHRDGILTRRRPRYRAHCCLAESPCSWASQSFSYYVTVARSPSCCRTSATAARSRLDRDLFQVVALAPTLAMPGPWSAFTRPRCLAVASTAAHRRRAPRHDHGTGRGLLLWIVVLDRQRPDHDPCA